VGNTNSTKVTTSAELINTNLLVEPIIFPDLSHVDVGVIVDQEKQNWFYPSGGKRVNMRDEIERTLRNCSQTVESEYEIFKARTNSQQHQRMLARKNTPSKTARLILRTTRKDVKTLNPLKEPLFYSKKSDTETKQLLHDLKNSQIKLRNVLCLEY
jgi:hypothetical protein